ncbi:MAG: cytochrome C [Deltaproteobacteria bacterium]|nr:cytochrome C [Deltaproteobacteria bacterium]MBW1922632.1 cytochrome C [Deltaproteobacteria bacterium]MBW1949407.1 cytochrome C [Deltaproteobacteria bacterium]MBW2008171.1 cytochrome C [Deltaproteobacteria bacterium]MBW2102707.1 cytochrome C [Deltaproteobacteria bacterium]
MYDGGKIIVGLIACLAFFLSPFIYDAGTAAKAPKPVLTEKAKEAGECVNSTPYMKAWHMHLLDTWRHTVVRNDERYYSPRREARMARLDKNLFDQWRHFVSDGARRYVPKEDKVYYKSLQETCLDCHSNKSKFCDECHNYMGVTPYCWDCHIQPEEKK